MKDKYISIIINLNVFFTIFFALFFIRINNSRISYIDIVDICILIFMLGIAYGFYKRSRICSLISLGAILYFDFIMLIMSEVMPSSSDSNTWLFIILLISTLIPLLGTTAVFIHHKTIKLD